MDLLIAFLVFLAAMAASLIFDVSMLIALGIGLLCFFAVGLRRGFPAKALGSMALNGMKKSLIVLRVFVLIGIITAAWRASGTIAFFVYYGIRLISPPLFLLVAFLLTSLIAFALGTSFGVVGTVGVILMTVARSGGVSPLLTAGAVLSGAYFGDRTAPTSSSANLVAVITDTRLYDNVRRMLKTGALPFGLATLGYLFFSLHNPLQAVDESILAALRGGFSLSPWVALPAVLMLLLPLLKIEVRHAMLASSLVALFLAVTAQKLPVSDALRACALGYVPTGDGLLSILAGGGLISMLKVAGIVLLSCAYSGIFEGTDLLAGVQSRLDTLAGRLGLGGATGVLSLAVCAVFCNQTIGVMMTQQLMAGAYRRRGAEGAELAMDLENTCIVIAGLVPWCIACAVPLQMLGVSVAALPCAFYIWLLPPVYLATKRWFFPSKTAPRS
ncbi:MAG: Na+/H+ antiporter NhaC family protein [Clostridiaceae bacterium]|nr:Na+/H+ antiporter NhaC family protein [Clostridiaceae bacterium]